MNGFRILWVEDHLDTLTALARVLQLRGHSVATAHSLAEARPLIAQNEFDVLLADIILPDGSGLELPQLIRRHNPACCCVAVSAHGRREQIARGLGAGFDYYLVKPVLMEALDEILDKCRPADRPQVTRR
jgi:DNA-binding response OmpR family regulator